jgi:hypothetical protein
MPRPTPLTVIAGHLAGIERRLDEHAAAQAQRDRALAAQLDLLLTNQRRIMAALRLDAPHLVALPALAAETIIVCVESDLLERAA